MDAALHDLHLSLNNNKKVSLLFETTAADIFNEELQHNKSSCAVKSKEKAYKGSNQRAAVNKDNAVAT